MQKQSLAKRYQAMKGNIQKLRDKLAGVTRYKSSDDPFSAPSRMRRATAMKKPLVKRMHNYRPQ